MSDWRKRESAFKVVKRSDFFKRYDILRGWKSLGYSRRRTPWLYEHPGIHFANFVDLSEPCSGGLHVCPLKTITPSADYYTASLYANYWGGDITPVYFLRGMLFRVYSPLYNDFKWKVSGFVIPGENESWISIEDKVRMMRGHQVFFYGKQLDSTKPRYRLLNACPPRSYIEHFFWVTRLGKRIRSWEDRLGKRIR